MIVGIDVHKRVVGTTTIEIFVLAIIVGTVIATMIVGTAFQQSLS